MLSIKSSVHCIGNFPEKVIKSTLDNDTGHKMQCLQAYWYAILEGSFQISMMIFVLFWKCS